MFARMGHIEDGMAPAVRFAAAAVGEPRCHAEELKGFALILAALASRGKT